RTGRQDGHAGHEGGRAHRDRHVHRPAGNDPWLVLLCTSGLDTWSTAAGGERDGSQPSCSCGGSPTATALFASPTRSDDVRRRQPGRAASVRVPAHVRVPSERFGGAIAHFGTSVSGSRIGLSTYVTRLRRTTRLLEYSARESSPALPVAHPR